MFLMLRSSYYSVINIAKKNKFLAKIREDLF